MAGFEVSAEDFNTNYFRDVVFVAGNQTVLTTQGPPSTVSWTYELGMKFSSAVGAEVRAIRFWRTSTAAATGKIWDTDPAKPSPIASVSIPAQSGTGWQQFELTSPLPIVANHTYIVSVDTNNAPYPYTYYAFVNPVNNPPLVAPTDAGVYGSIGTKPSSTDASSNYYRDVVVSRAQEIMRGLAPASTISSSAPWELGTRFSSNASGRITGVRFFKASGGNDEGTHVGKIWANNGKLLAAVVFRAETASGWQEEPLPVPVMIQPGITYVVSVNAGREPERTSSTPYTYVYTTGGFQVSLSHRHLTVPTGGGVYNQGAGVFPQGTSPSNFNYYRDVVFIPD